MFCFSVLKHQLIKPLIYIKKIPLDTTTFITVKVQM